MREASNKEEERHGSVSVGLWVAGTGGEGDGDGDDDDGGGGWPRGRMVESWKGVG